MKRTSSSPATGIFPGSDSHPNETRRPLPLWSSALRSLALRLSRDRVPASFIEASSHETTGDRTSAVSDNAGYVSDSVQSDSMQWPPDDNGESLPDQHQQSYLCSRCREIDFDEILSRKTVARGGDPIMLFDDAHRILQDPECAFCRAMEFIHPSLDAFSHEWRQVAPLVVATVDDRDNAPPRKKLNVGENKICLTFGCSGINYYCPPRSIYRWTESQVQSKIPYEGHVYNPDLVGYLAEEQTINSDHEALPAALVNLHVDFDLIKRNLDNCRASHSRCRNRRLGGVSGMRLIDCKTRTVVPAPKGGCTYAALSYVWGTSKSISRGRPASNNCHEELLADLPNTIADAILVALKLNIRYLWCDRYCIRQDPRNKEEKDEKHGQIARMYDIYNRASITIIAAAGDGPDYGLPGVGNKRQQPPRVRIGSRTLFSTFPDPKTLIDRSKWSTRGWTFQEGLLARRRLVFTDQQVYFHCEEAGTFEARGRCGEMSISCSSTSRLDGYSPVYPYFSRIDTGVWTQISRYTKRTLGNTQDILNGFLGVLKNYEEPTCPIRDLRVRNVAGLPVIIGKYKLRSWPSALFSALAWICNIPGSRRDGFPSWSWIGWHCEGLYHNDRTNRTPKYLPQSRRLFVSVEGTNKELLKHKKLHKLLEARHDFSETKFLRVTAPSLEARVIPANPAPEYCPCLYTSMNGLGNTEQLAVRYSGSERVSCINISDKRLLDALPSNGLQCFGIILGEPQELEDIRSHPRGGKETPLTYLMSSGPRIERAITLIVVEKGGGFERIGVSHIDSEELRRLGSKGREFRLM